jgi:hypothetical protein
VTHWSSRVDTIFHAPAHPFLGNISFGFKISDDLASCPFGDTHRRGDLATCDSMVFGKDTQHQSMISKKHPLGHYPTPFSQLPLRFGFKDLATNLLDNFMNRKYMMFALLFSHHAGYFMNYLSLYNTK